MSHHKPYQSGSMNYISEVAESSCYAFNSEYALPAFRGQDALDRSSRLCSQSSERSTWSVADIGFSESMTKQPVSSSIVSRCHTSSSSSPVSLSSRSQWSAQDRVTSAPDAATALTKSVGSEACGVSSTSCNSNLECRLPLSVLACSPLPVASPPQAPYRSTSPISSPQSPYHSTSPVTSPMQSPCHSSISPVLTPLPVTSPMQSPCHSSISPVLTPLPVTSPVQSPFTPLSITSPVQSPYHSISPALLPVTSPLQSSYHSISPALLPVTSPLQSPYHSISPALSPVQLPYHSISPVSTPLPVTSPLQSPYHSTSPALLPVTSSVQSPYSSHHSPSTVPLVSGVHRNSPPSLMDLPLEHLLAGCSNHGNPSLVPSTAEDADVSQSSTASEEILYTQNLTLDKAMIARDLLGEDSDKSVFAPSRRHQVHHWSLSPVKVSDQRQFPPSSQWSDTMLDSRSLVNFHQLPPTVPLGNGHQARLPEVLPKARRQETDVLRGVDQLLWSPSRLSESEVERYLVRSAHLCRQKHTSDVHRQQPDCLPALDALVACSYDVSAAWSTLQCRPPSRSSTPDLSQDEVVNFEAGLKLFGKNFNRIRRFKMPQRSVIELVHFYYRWKTSHRSRYQSILPKQLDKRKQLLRCTSIDPRCVEDREVGLPQAGGGDVPAPVSADLEMLSSLRVLFSSSVTAAAALPSVCWDATTQMSLTR